MESAALPNVASARIYANSGLAVVDGEDLSEGATINWRTEDQVIAMPPLYASDTSIVSPAPQTGTSEIYSVWVESSNGQSNNFPNVQVDDDGFAEHVLIDSAARTPFRLVFIANPFLRERSKVKHDPILKNQAFFRKQLATALFDLFARDPTDFLSIPEIRNGIRISVVFPSALARQRVKESLDHWVLCQRRRVRSKYKIEASRTRVAKFLESLQGWADVAVVLSGARSAIPTAWFGTDDDTRGGAPFVFDGESHQHAYYSAMQGVIAFSVRPIRPFEFRHEFLHASSSFNNGQILDEYNLSRPYTEPGVDRPFAVNKKFVDPGEAFATYNAETYSGVRIGSGSKRRYVPTPEPGRPCIMRGLSVPPLADSLIRDFMVDRLLARIRRGRDPT